MTDPYSIVIIALSALSGIGILTVGALRGWRGWLELKRAELQQHARSSEIAPSSAGSRIEIADLKERIRKLEAIAAGVDL
ncbi:hypothetical protein [Sphingomonas colocasiae]|jgi:hypothetical protein|uniref:Uncharacterized protein n=1 Tax=Sphingomonas colocasiae TaxID=1848973 RepID=A0ABS7PNK1_9SPHN|nr:hypothetical protein [Sphingomonas colocasiae]MBY8822893.1 hypothetical protein [Sphingomonas colocasiae]